MASRIGLIGGTGLSRFEGVNAQRAEAVDTPYGAPSSELVHGIFGDNECVFLARHGGNYTVPPHAINYRANIWAMKSAGVDYVVAINTVGGIAEEFAPGSLAVPDQLIDYTWGREQTYFNTGDEPIRNLDFTEPYSRDVRERLLASAGNDLAVTPRGTVGVVQGPRLETAAEIDRMKRDGCDLVGMTSMPEAVLAREVELELASLAVVVNYAAGLGEGGIHDQLDKFMAQALDTARQILAKL